MLAFLASSLGRDALIGGLVLLLLGGAFGYYEWSKSEIATLTSNLTLVTKQADDLTTANKKMAADIAAVSKAQATANQSITQARTTAAQAAAKVRSTPAPKDAATVNAQFGATLSDLSGVGK